MEEPTTQRLLLRREPGSDLGLLVCERHVQQKIGENTRRRSSEDMSLLLFLPVTCNLFSRRPEDITQSIWENCPHPSPEKVVKTSFLVYYDGYMYLSVLYYY